MVSYQRYYSPSEIESHCTIDDIWVSYLGCVYDLTQLCKDHEGDICLKPIVHAAGTDISHWFDASTGNLRTYLDPHTNCVLPYCPNGRFLHVPPPCPSSDWANDFGQPWWKRSMYMVGILTEKTRRVRIENTLTSQSHVVEVCCEETIDEILERYLKYNAHARSYTWMYNRRPLNMKNTLEENDIPDEDENFHKLYMDDNTYLQCIHLYFNDDLTEF